MDEQADQAKRVTLTGMLVVGLLWAGLGIAAVLQWGIVRGGALAVWGVSVPAIVVMIGLEVRPSRRSAADDAGAPAPGSVQVA